MLQDTVKCPRGKIVARFTSYGDATDLGGMFVLPVTTSSLYVIPAIFLDQADDVADLHRAPILQDQMGSEDEAFDPQSDRSSLID